VPAALRAGRWPTKARRGTSTLGLLQESPIDLVVERLLADAAVDKAEAVLWGTAMPPWRQATTALSRLLDPLPLSSHT
jgi:hypothetical protein